MSIPRKWGCGQMLDLVLQVDRWETYVKTKACQPCVRGEITHAMPQVIGTWADVAARKLRDMVARDEGLTPAEAMVRIETRRALKVPMSGERSREHCRWCGFREREHREQFMCPTGAKSAKTFTAHVLTAVPTMSRVMSVPALAHPAPAVRAADGVLPDGWVMPDSVLKLCEHAREAGWDVRVTYSRGHGVHATTGRTTAERHVIAVRIGRHVLSDMQATAVYESPVSRKAWTWGSVWVWGPTLMFFRVPLLEELKYFLSAGGVVPAGWVDDIRTRVRAAEAKKKAQPRTTSRTVKEGN